jgi:hypothetical protein
MITAAAPQWPENVETENFWKNGSFYPYIPFTYAIKYISIMLDSDFILICKLLFITLF